MEPRSRFGDNPAKFREVCPQNGAAVLKGLIDCRARFPFPESGRDPTNLLLIRAEPGIFKTPCFCHRRFLPPTYTLCNQVSYVEKTLVAAVDLVALCVARCAWSSSRLRASRGMIDIPPPHPQMSPGGKTIESRTHIVGECEVFKEERDVLEEEMRENRWMRHGGV